MTVTLSPVPTGTVALENAIAYLRSQMGTQVDGPVTPAGERGEKVDYPDDARCAELLNIASAMVEREAPSAPTAIKNESVVRYAGYLQESVRTRRFGAIRRAEVSTTPGGYAGSGSSVLFEATTNHAAMFMHSGAKGLLAPWKVRRAGGI